MGQKAGAHDAEQLCILPSQTPRGLGRQWETFKKQTLPLTLQQGQSSSIKNHALKHPPNCCRRFLTGRLNRCTNLSEAGGMSNAGMHSPSWSVCRCSPLPHILQNIIQTDETKGLTSSPGNFLTFDSKYMHQSMEARPMEAFPTPISPLQLKRLATRLGIRRKTLPFSSIRKSPLWNNGTLLGMRVSL